MSSSGSPSLTTNTTSDCLPNLVQEIAASLIGQQVPEGFLYKNGYPPAHSGSANTLWMNDLLIDFSLLSAPDTDPSALAELQKLRNALCSWGCFQVRNHGIEKELLDRVLEVSREFFSLPEEERRKCAGTLPFNGYGTDAQLAGSHSWNWNDRLWLMDPSVNAGYIATWPENPPKFSEIYNSYTMKLGGIPEILMKAMARSLDLDEGCFVRKQGVQWSFTARVNFYPCCPKPEHVLGLKPHGDGSIFTVLLQDKIGLQVMKDEQWFRVPVIPGALFINMGDLMEIMSNGVIKSAFHRVVTSLEDERITLSMFYSPSADRVIDPVEEMVTTNRPQEYKAMTIMKYAEAVFLGNPFGGRTLHAFKL